MWQQKHLAAFGVWQPAFQPLGGATAWLLAAELVTFGA
jgi:hypothetical protein